MRRHPHDPLTGRDQRLLEPARDVPAVLDRPHPLVIEPARPAHRGQMPRLLGPDLARAAHRPVPASTAASACVRLCVSAPITIICTVPSIWLSTDEADLRRTTVTGGDATLLLGHAGGPRAAAGDTSFAGQTSQTTQPSRVSPPPAREPTAAVGRHRPDPSHSDSDRRLHCPSAGCSRKSSLSGRLVDVGGGDRFQARLLRKVPVVWRVHARGRCADRWCPAGSAPMVAAALWTGARSTRAEVLVVTRP